MKKKSKPRVKKYSKEWGEQKITKAEKNSCSKCGRVDDESMDLLIKTINWRLKKDSKHINELTDVINKLNDHIAAQDKILDEINKHLPGMEQQYQEIWKERNDAVRAYTFLHEAGKFCEEQGIDIKAMATPEQKEFAAKYDMYHMHEVTEGGKTRYKVKMVPKKGKHVPGQN